MSSLIIVILHPLIYVGLQLLHAAVNFASECSGGVELVLNGLVKAFADAFGMWTFGLGASVIDVLQVKIELKLVVLEVPLCQTSCRLVI
jgi:hypothetical protein